MRESDLELVNSGALSACGLRAIAVNKIVSDINSKTLFLTKQPFIASIESLLADDPRAFRSLLAFKEKFQILYYVDSGNVNITYVWNCKQDPKKMGKRSAS